MDSASPSWMRSVFSHDQVIQWTKAKVLVYSDSVLCLGKMNDSRIGASCQSCTCGMQAWSNQGEKMLVSVESIGKFDNSALAFDCSDEAFRSIEASLYQVFAQNDSKPTAENSATDKRTEGIRSMARDREKVRSEEHVGQKISTCSTDQQHF